MGKKIGVIKMVKNLLTIGIGMSGGYPIDGKKKEKSGEKMHPAIRKQWIAFVAIVVIAAIALYFAFVPHAPMETKIGSSTETGSNDLSGSNSQSVIGAVSLVAVPITSLIPVPANVQPMTAISINNPPEIMQFAHTPGIEGGIYVTNIVFTNSMFAADIENRYSEPQALQEISLELPGIAWSKTWFYSPIYSPDGGSNAKNWLILPADTKVRVETDFSGLPEKIKPLIKSASLHLGQ